MCQFLSAVILRNGDVLTHPMLDSHTDLIRYYKLPDTTAYHQHFAKVELTPVDWMDPATWTFRLDEDTAPSWWDDVATGVEATLRARAEKMILRGDHDLIVDGCWIIGGAAKIRDVRSGRIMRVQGSAQIHRVGGSAQIHGVGGSAQIHRVGGSAQIHGVGDSAQIHDVRDRAQIHRVWDSAQIHGVWDRAQIHDVRDRVTLSESAKKAVVK